MRASAAVCRSLSNRLRQKPDLGNKDILSGRFLVAGNTVLISVSIHTWHSVEAGNI